MQSGFRSRWLDEDRHPLQGVEVAIRGEAGSFLPSGQVGQIVVKGRSVMTGYLHRPPLAGDWLDTGDLGELDDSGTLLSMRGEPI